MAVMLSPETESTWLHGEPADASELLEPYPDDELTAYPVSERVNSPANDDPSLVEAVSS